MADDSVSSPVSEVNASQTADIPNRPELTSDLSAPASKSASTQPEPSPPQDQTSAEVATEPNPPQSASLQAPSTPEPTQSPEAPLAEPVSVSTSSQTEPPASTPSAQGMSPEVEPNKEENQTMQTTTEAQNINDTKATPPQNEAPASPAPPPFAPLHYPFYGSYPVAFDFGAQPSDENIKKKYQEWGIVGHNGIDFGLPEGTDVLACDEGTVIQVGDNGDFGISITIKHSWGTSIYSHLQSFGVLVNDHVGKAHGIGASGKTGFVTGPHLHFSIQPSNPDTNNGYLGYVNPNPYLLEKSEKPQSQSQKPPDLSPELSVEKPPEEISKQEELPGVSPETQIPVAPPVDSSTNQDEIQKQVVAMFDARIKENSIKGNQAKKAKRDEAMQKIFTFAQEKKRVTNEQIRDLLHVSQSTATDYLSDFVSRGMLKVEGKGKATVYFF